MHHKSQGNETTKTRRPSTTRSEVRPRNDNETRSSDIFDGRIHQEKDISQGRKNQSIELFDEQDN
jgi:hypothetical protein